MFKTSKTKKVTISTIMQVFVIKWFLYIQSITRELPNVTLEYVLLLNNSTSVYDLVEMGSG